MSPTTDAAQTAAGYLRDPAHAEDLTHLRALANCPHPAQVGFDTRWMVDQGLVAQSNMWYEFRARFVVTELGRLALAALMAAP